MSAASSAPTSAFDEFVAAAAEAARRSGPEAPEALGWFDFLADLDDPDSRAAVFALFRAQGRELTSSVAFGALLAHPYGMGEGRPGSVAAAVIRRSVRRGEVALVVGDLPTDDVIIDRPGHGVVVVPVADLELVPVDVPGRVPLHELASIPDRAASIADRDAEPLRRRALQLGRLAASMEMVGAAETVLSLAVDYVGQREQFGQPIGSFQAIRHLLAWARMDVAAMESAARRALDLHTRMPEHFDETVKALAGRNARRVCERTLQSFGGVGFTQEHDHHLFHSRVLAFDSVLGSSAELSAAIGARLRTSGGDHRIAATLLGL